MIAIIARLATVFAILAVSVASMPADAAQPPRVKAYQCRTLARSTPAKSIWWTVFTGEREGFFVKRETYRAVPCFKSVASCKAWLYWAQSDWPHMNSVQPCRRGLPY